MSLDLFLEQFGTQKNIQLGVSDKNLTEPDFPAEQRPQRQTGSGLLQTGGRQVTVDRRLRKQSYVLQNHAEREQVEIQFAGEDADRRMFATQTLDFDQQERFDLGQMVIVTESQQKAEAGEQQKA